jgi:hypothetical protein
MSSEGVDTFISTINGNSDKFRNSKRERTAVLSSINIIKSTTTNPDDSAKLEELMSNIKGGGKRAVVVTSVRPSKKSKNTLLKIHKGGATVPPAGSIVLGNGSVINPVNGAIIQPPGFVNPPQAGGIYSSSGTIIPSAITIDESAPTANIQPRTTAPIGSMILGNGSIIDRVSGTQLAPPATMSTTDGTPLIGGVVIGPGYKAILPNPPGSYPVTVPTGTPVNSIVHADGSIYNPATQSYISPAGSTNAIPGSIVSPLQTFIPPRNVTYKPTGEILKADGTIHAAAPNTRLSSDFSYVPTLNTAGPATASRQASIPASLGTIPAGSTIGPGGSVLNAFGIEIAPPNPALVPYIGNIVTASGTLIPPDPQAPTSAVGTIPSSLTARIPAGASFQIMFSDGEVRRVI